MNYELNSREKYINKAEIIDKLKLIGNDLQQKSVKAKRNQPPKFKYQSALDIAYLKKDDNQINSETNSQKDKTSMNEGFKLIQTNFINSIQSGNSNLKPPISSVKNSNTNQERNSYNKMQTNTNEVGDLMATYNSITSNGMEKSKGPKNFYIPNADKDSYKTNNNNGINKLLIIA